MSVCPTSTVAVANLFFVITSRSIATLLLIVSLNNTAHSAIQQFNFTGTVTSAANAPFETLVGMDVSGSFSYDTETPIDPSTSMGTMYRQPDSARQTFSFSVGEFSFSSTDALWNTADIGRAVLVGDFTSYDVFQFNVGNMANYFNFTLIDYSATALANEDLPTDLNLSDYGQRTGNFYLIEYNSVFSFNVESISAVPLPATAWLLLCSVGGLLSFQRMTR